MTQDSAQFQMGPMDRRLGEVTAIEWHSTADGGGDLRLTTASGMDRIELSAQQATDLLRQMLSFATVTMEPES